MKQISRIKEPIERAEKGELIREKEKLALLEREYLEEMVIEKCSEKLEKIQEQLKIVERLKRLDERDYIIRRVIDIQELLDGTEKFYIVKGKDVISFIQEYTHGDIIVDISEAVLLKGTTLAEIQLHKDHYFGQLSKAGAGISYIYDLGVLYNYFDEIKESLPYSKKSKIKKIFETLVDSNAI